MKRKKHTSSENALKKDTIIVESKQNGSKESEHVLSPTKVPELTLAEQQALTNKVMATLRNAQQEPRRFSGIITTIRDIVTSTDSFLIRSTAYAVSILLILGILSGVFFLFTAITSNVFAHHAGFSLSHPLTSPVPSPDSAIGKMAFKRSVEQYILSQT